MHKLLISLIALSLLALACSEGRVAIREGDGSQDDAIGGDGNSDGATSNNDVTSGGDATNGGDSTTTSNDTNTTNNDTSTSGCTNGITRCSLAGNIETCLNGIFVETSACAAGCQASTCIDAPLSGRCGAPVTITLGQTVVGTTDTVYNPNTWLQECSNANGGNAPTGPETVFELDMPSPMQVKVVLDAIDSTYFAVYIRGVCDDIGTQLHSSCGASGSPGSKIEIPILLAKGKHYIFVDDFDDPQFGPGRFKLRVEEGLMTACGGQIPQLLDPSNGPVTVQGDTANGADSEEWLEYHCPNDAIQSTGSERVYAFALRDFSNVAISGTPTNPTSSQMGVYVRTDCNDKFSQLFDEPNHRFTGCGYTDGNSAATINGQYRPGAYYIFVDDFPTSTDESQQFTLTLNAP